MHIKTNLQLLKKVTGYSQLFIISENEKKTHLILQVLAGALS